LTKTTYWNTPTQKIQTKLLNIKFFQIDWSMLLFTMISWPKDHYTVAPSFLSERWLRFYVHFLPSKMAKKNKSRIKTIWMKHRPEPAVPTTPKTRKRMKPKPPRQGHTQTRYLYV
jgi:hypothetical protein